MRFIKLAILLLLSVSFLESNCQSFDGIWYDSQEREHFIVDVDNGCITFYSFYDQEDCKRIKYKLKGNQLKIIHYSNEILPGIWQKEKSIFKLKFLSSYKIELKLLKSKDGALMEVIGILERQTKIFNRKYSSSSEAM